MKPTPELINDWHEKARQMAIQADGYFDDVEHWRHFAELAAAWGAEQARDEANNTPSTEHCLWARNGHTPCQHTQQVQALQTTEEPELPEAVAWKPVVGFEGLYSVSTNGDIVNNKTGKQIAKNSTGAGYIKADLFKDGLRTQTSAHRVVAAAFLGSLEGKEVNHKDGDKTNNKLSNLELVTRQENVLHGYYALGHLVKPVIGTCIKTGEKKRYASLSEVRNDGFKPTHVASCASKIPTHNTHKGWTWEFETSTQMHDHFAAGVRAGMARGQTLQALQRGFEKVLADPEKHGLDLGEKQ